MAMQTLEFCVSVGWRIYVEFCVSTSVATTTSYTSATNLRGVRRCAILTYNNTYKLWALYIVESLASAAKCIPHRHSNYMQNYY